METAKAVRIGRALAEADLVIIGASNGLDMAEGLNLFCADAHFQEAYGDLAQADGIGCILQGLASPDASVRRRWAERFHQKEYLEYEPGSLMNGLRRLTEHADTFVVTCNIDGHFARAGFDENRVLETEECSYSFVNWAMLFSRLNRDMLTPGLSADGLQSVRSASTRRRRAPCPA